MIVLHYYGYLPDPFVRRPDGLTRANIIFINGLLLIIAATSAYAASVLTKNREKRCLQNLELKKSHTELAKSEFLANMSHELRTPLNHIVGFTKLAVEKYLGNLNKNQEEYPRDVLNTSKLPLSLTDDILILSRVESGKLELQPAAADIRATLSNSLSIIEERSIKDGIRVSLEIDEDVPEAVRADERKLKKGLYNLISNATKFVPDGGTVSVSACLYAEKRSCEAETYLRFSVTGNGVGIKPENVKRIFDPFEQVEPSLSRKYEGTGLGLFLSKRPVELLVGKIPGRKQGKGKLLCFHFCHCRRDFR